MTDNTSVKPDNNTGYTLKPYLSPLSVWALSFGCAVGWGSFVMPGTTFLPLAGPLGTTLGIIIGAVIMFIIGMNYHYLMNRYPDSGGTLTYAIRSFGYDHGFLSAWFLILVYIAIIWANATAIVLIARNLLGSLFQFGFLYSVLGYDVYLGEVLITMAVIVIFGLICAFSKPVTVGLQVILAIALLAGIVFCYACVVMHRDPGALEPGFVNGDTSHITQIIAIVALSPWAFAGFESVSNSVEGFKFSVKKTIWIFLIVVICAAMAYVCLARMAASLRPEGYDGWFDYISGLSGMHGVEGIPTFYAAGSVLGQKGLIILGVGALSGIITGLVGNFIAASRLMYYMSQERFLPKWFGTLNSAGTPYRTILFLTGISLVIPFFGRTAIGWIIDVNTVGATIAYGYTSAAAYHNAKKENDLKFRTTGVIGIAVSVIFFLYFMFSTGKMATESYLILILWSILGFVYFRILFEKDDERRFGKSTVAWIGLLFLIFFTSLMWVRHSTDDTMRMVVDNISDYYEEENSLNDPSIIADTERYISEQMSEAQNIQTRNSIIQMCIIIASLSIMFSIYSTMSKRERSMEIDKFKAEESNRAKSTFLSNMSHDLRTPMNAIVGYVNLAQRDIDDHDKVVSYISKIKTSSHHLLALINDVLEMSRIESGHMSLEPVPMDLKIALNEVEEMFSIQMAEKKITFTLDTGSAGRTGVMCDKNRLNRVLLNLIGNAWKFTPEGGKVTVRLTQNDSPDPNTGSFVLTVSDTGIGMSGEFAAKVFEAFEREEGSAADKIQGTGLGMAITKSIVELMGGTIEVDSKKGVGTAFTIHVNLEYADLSEQTESLEASAGSEEDHTDIDFSYRRVLLVEDMEINRELAIMQLTGLGFDVETAVNGREAVDKIMISAPGYYDAVLMDIQMPVLNGYEATREIRRINDPGLANIPVIAMTANAFAEDIKKAYDAGMNAHIAKPIDVDNMANVLREIISSRT